MQLTRPTGANYASETSKSRELCEQLTRLQGANYANVVSNLLFYRKFTTNQHIRLMIKERLIDYIHNSIRQNWKIEALSDYKGKGYT